MDDSKDCKHGYFDESFGCKQCDKEETILDDRERIIEALKKLPGSNGRRAEQIIRGMEIV